MTHQTRRELLRRGALSAAGLTVLPLAGACGASDEPETAAGARDATDGPRAPRTVALGLEDEVVALGVTPVGVGVPYTGALAPYLARRLRGVPTVGESFAPSLERVAALRPELIVADQYLDEEMGSELRRIADVGVVTKGAEGGVPGARDALLQTGAVLGLEREARARADLHARRMADAAERLRGVDGRVVFLRVRTDEIRLVARTWGYIGPVLYGDLGLRPAPIVAQADRRDADRKHGHDDLSLERIPELEADILLYTSDDDDALGRVQRIWDRVPAVAEGRAHRVEPVSWQSTAVLANEAKARDVVRLLA